MSLVSVTHNKLKLNDDKTEALIMSVNPEF